MWLISSMGRASDSECDRFHGPTVLERGSISVVEGVLAIVSYSLPLLYVRGCPFRALGFSRRDPLTRWIIEAFGSSCLAVPLPADCVRAILLVSAEYSH